jgi:putative Mn2+ efflux pump MntP
MISSLFIAFGLAMDSFAVSLGIGTSGRCCSTRPVFRVAFHMGLFQGLMTFLGLLAGSRLGECFGKRMEILGGLILNGIGVRILLSHIL